MKLEKRWYSYINFYLCFVLLSALTVTLVVTVFDVRAIGSNLAAENKWVDIVIKPVLGTLFLTVVCGIFSLIRHFRAAVFKMSGKHKKSVSFFSFVVFILLLFCGLFFRYQYIQNIIFNDEIINLVRKLYVGENTGVFSSLKFYFLWVNAFIARFVGIRDYAYVYVNVALELCSACVLYFSLKRIFGRTCAMGSFAVMMLLSAEYFQISDTKGLFLLGFVASIVFYFFSIFLKERFNRTSQKQIHIIWVILFGLIAGFIAYLDILGLIAFAVMAIALLIYRPKRVKEFTEENPEEQLEKFGDIIIYPEGVTDDDYIADALWHKNTIPLIIFIVCGALSFGSMFYVDMITYSNWPIDYILYNNRYLQNIIGAFYNNFTLGRFNEELTVLMMAATFGCFAFFKSKYDKVSLPFFALLFAYIVYTYTGRNNDMYLVLVPVIGVFVGICLDSLFFEQISIVPIFKKIDKPAEKTIVDNILDLDKVSLGNSLISNDEVKISDKTEAQEKTDDISVVKEIVKENTVEDYSEEVISIGEVVTESPDNSEELLNVDETVVEKTDFNEMTVSEENKTIISEVAEVSSLKLNIDESYMQESENSKISETELIGVNESNSSSENSIDGGNLLNNSEADSSMLEINVDESNKELTENSNSNVVENLSDEKTENLDNKENKDEPIQRVGNAKFIENILPVPKKHVKKEMDYAFEPSEDKMKYDVEISDEDDFDIRIY